MASAWVPCSVHGVRGCRTCAITEASDRTTAAIEEQTRQAVEAEARTQAALVADRAERDRLDRERQTAALTLESQAEDRRLRAEHDERIAQRAADEEKLAGIAAAEAERRERREQVVEARVAELDVADYEKTYYRNLYRHEFDVENPEIRESLTEKYGRLAADLSTSSSGVVRTQSTVIDESVYDRSISTREKQDADDRFNARLLALVFLVATAIGLISSAVDFFTTEKSWASSAWSGFGTGFIAFLGLGVLAIAVSVVRGSRGSRG